MHFRPFCFKFHENFANGLRVSSDESCSLLEFLVYFNYYLWVSLYFLILFISFTVLFN